MKGRGVIRTLNERSKLLALETFKRNASLLVRSVSLVPLVSFVTLTTPLPLISLTTVLPRPFADFLLAAAAVVSSDRVLDLSPRIKLKIKKNKYIFCWLSINLVYQVSEKCKQCLYCKIILPGQTKNKKSKYIFCWLFINLVFQVSEKCKQ